MDCEELDAGLSVFYRLVELALLLREYFGCFTPHIGHGALLYFDLAKVPVGTRGRFYWLGDWLLKDCRPGADYRENLAVKADVLPVE